VPIDKIKESEHAIHEASANPPDDLCARFETADKLDDGDRKIIIETARVALIPFQPKPEPKPEDNVESKPAPGSKHETLHKSEPGSLPTNLVKQ
jgi:F-type H+-transporting ATPase subunit alpha